MPKKILFLGLFCFASLTGISQYEPYVNLNITITQEMPKAEEGTYQITVNPKFSPVFTTELLYFIEQNRKEDEDITISLMYCAELFIPSKNKISSPNFEPLQSIIR